EAADLVITPDVAKVGTFSDVNYDEVVNLGIEAAEKMLPQLKELVAEKCHTWAHTPPSGGYHFKRPEVVEVRFVGVPEGIANELQKRCAGWINQPLDMKKVAETVTQLSNRKDIKAVDGRTENISRDKVAVIFNIERPPKYEFGLDGFASNLYPNPWVSFQGTMHDALMAGDTVSLEYRFGSNQGAMLRYFTLETSSDTQWGFILAGRREMYDPSNFVSQEFDRYTARLAWYKQLSPRTRMGLGYAAEMVTSLTPDDINRNGPYLSLSFNTLDDPVLPTKGLIFDTSLWFPFEHRAVTATNFKLFVPVKNFGRMTIGGGLKTGDAENLAFAATLGSRLELYSLGQHPLVGDQAYWVHLGFEKNLMRSWWGGINVEIFGNYGQVMDGWTNSGSHWEVGAALSIPTNKFGGKLLLIYDQNDEFIIGYTIGMPRFWDGPMP
ncbi:MAG: hypothetical protein HUJ86_02400, partial [Synergistes sp.]|nr:hypothetical protein [Synergistes sp.]